MDLVSNIRHCTKWNSINDCSSEMACCYSIYFRIAFLTEGDNNYTKTNFGPLYSAINDVFLQFYNYVHN